MKKLLEPVVLGGFYQAYAGKNRKYLRFNEIAMLSKVKKSTLQRVLNRLVKRGWIRKIEAYSQNGLLPGDYQKYYTAHIGNNEEEKPVIIIKEFKEEFDDRVSELESVLIGLRQKPYQEKRKQILAKIIRNNTPKKYTFYTLQSFPYLIGYVQNIQEGSKRIWKKAASYLKNWENEYKKKSSCLSSYSNRISSEIS